MEAAPGAFVIPVPDAAQNENTMEDSAWDHPEMGRVIPSSYTPNMDDYFVSDGDDDLDDPRYVNDYPKRTLNDAAGEAVVHAHAPGGADKAVVQDQEVVVVAAPVVGGADEAVVQGQEVVAVAASVVDSSASI